MKVAFSVFRAQGLRLVWGFIGLILGLYWGDIGIMENKMETTV